MANDTNYTAMAVCSGNVQRSPICHAVLSYTVSQTLSPPYKVQFDSSGINVKRQLANYMPVQNMLRMIEAGLFTGFIGSETRGPAEQIVKKFREDNQNITTKDREALNTIYAQVRPLVQGANAAFRNEALAHYGLPKEFIPNRLHNPFPDSVDGLDIILAMDKEVLDEVKSTIGNTDKSLATYGQLSGTQTDVKDDIRGGLESAKSQVGYFMDTRHKALEEIFKLLSSKT